MIIMASEAGGMDIEDVAEKTPEKIIKVYVDPNVGIQGYHLRAAAFGLNMPKASMQPFTVLLKNLYNLAVSYDCSLVEINPLIITAEDDVIALDGKMDFDDNALYRHPDDPRHAHLEGATVPLAGHTVPVHADREVDPDFGTGLMMGIWFSYNLALIPILVAGFDPFRQRPPQLQATPGEPGVSTPMAGSRRCWISGGSRVEITTLAEGKRAASSATAMAV